MVAGQTACQTNMNENSIDPHSILACWAICSPDRFQSAPTLPDSPGWKEISGPDVWLYLRLTRSAAKELAARLLASTNSPETFEVVVRPQGAFDDSVSDDGSGFFGHPKSASLTIRVVDIPPIDDLMSLANSGGFPQLLSPDGRNNESTVFQK